MSVDTTLWFLAILMEGFVFGLLLRKKISRQLPIFTSYMAWTALSDLSMWAVHRYAAPHYAFIYGIEISIDAVLQFCVLVELAWSALRPARSILPRYTLLGVVGLILVMGAAIWPLAGISALPTLTSQLRQLIHLQQTFTILRIAFFLALAAVSQLLAIGWRNRELQVATGLGFYSLASLAGSLVQVHQASISEYLFADRLVRISYFCSLLYWVASFVRKEAPRGEFSPRMQKFLLAVAGAAHADRLALEQARKGVRR